MKKILFTLVFMLSFMLNADAQYKKSHRSSVSYSADSKIGLGITGSGLVFTAAGFLTPPDYTWISANTSGYSAGHWQKKPFMEQGSRSMCIVTGVTLTLCGLITMIAGR